ncbi:hypothetical protein [Paenibacillus sp. FSL R7-0333]|uniref:hypothetical protein n=1 Tax=Paenibacillus sp. FSL R7-0333 TaxID=1926587 RepID=UPI00096EE8B8|nr:hypothetical protein BK146_08290 [Paenibacillus sp. FSL R7-0333]
MRLSKLSSTKLNPGVTDPAPSRPVKNTAQQHLKPFFQKYFWLLAVGALALYTLAFADRYYVTALGLGVQQGLITAKTVQAALLWLTGILLTLKLYVITVRAKDKFKGGYRFFYYFSFLNWPAAVLLLLTLVFQAPQQSTDLVQYWTSSRFTEKPVQITNTYKSCGPNSSCTLVVDTSNQGRFRVNGYMNSLILAYEPHITALRYLPASRRIINIRTAEGWLE